MAGIVPRLEADETGRLPLRMAAREKTPKRILMTTDAVGGVWRYSVDLARALNAEGVQVVLACLGPAPTVRQDAEIANLSATSLVSLEAPLDWMVPDTATLSRVPALLAKLAETEGADLIHLNLPSQANGMVTDRPVIAVSHSCVVTWWDAMRGGDLPSAWTWQHEMNLGGLRRAGRVLAPTRAHAEALSRVYGTFGSVDVVPNAVRATGDGAPASREPFVFAAARWWDEGKNAAVIDQAALGTAWPVKVAGACHGGEGQSYGFTNAEWLGELPYGETRDQMRRAGIFVSPSRYEPFGLAAAEAAEAGTALVLADIATYRELWSGAALFADPLDPDSFRSAINQLIADEPLRLALSTAARERASIFTPERQCQAVLSAYRDVELRRTSSSATAESFV